MGVNSGRQMDFPWDILNGPRMGNLEAFLVGNFDGEVLGRSADVWVGRPAKGYCSVHQTGTGSGNVRVGCLVGLVDG